MAKKRVLIVDDEADVREAVKFALEDDDIECIEAGDGTTALELARHENPDLILLDIMLPKLDGYKIARLLKFDHAYKHIPIIMVTAKSQAEDVRLGEETGADGYITKPFDMDALVAVVRKSLAVAKAQQQVLVVDDDPDIIESVRFGLQAEGIGCLSAADGDQAVEVAKREVPDLVLLDVMLPGISGRQVARALRHDSVCGHIPIIMLTALSDQRDFDSAAEAGADGYITKPFEMDALVDVVKKYLDREVAAVK